MTNEIIWVAGLLGHLVLLTVLFARKRVATFPWFTLLIIFYVVRSVGLAVALRGFRSSGILVRDHDPRHHGRPAAMRPSGRTHLDRLEAAGHGTPVHSAVAFDCERRAHGHAPGAARPPLSALDPGIAALSAVRAYGGVGHRARLFTATFAALVAQPCCRHHFRLCGLFRSPAGRGRLLHHRPSDAGLCFFLFLPHLGLSAYLDVLVCDALVRGQRREKDGTQTRCKWRSLL